MAYAVVSVYVTSAIVGICLPRRNVVVAVLVVADVSL